MALTEKRKKRTPYALFTASDMSIMLGVKCEIHSKGTVLTTKSNPDFNGLLEILKWWNLSWRNHLYIQHIELCIASQGSNSLPHERPKISKSTYTEMKLISQIDHLPSRSTYINDTFKSIWTISISYITKKTKRAQRSPVHCEEKYLDSSHILVILSFTI